MYGIPQASNTQMAHTLDLKVNVELQESCEVHFLECLRALKPRSHQAHILYCLSSTERV